MTVDGRRGHWRKAVLFHSLWVTPPLIVALFLTVSRFLSRDAGIKAAHFFLSEVFWLALPYGLVALAAVVVAARARQRWLAAAAAAALLLAISAIYARFIEPERIVVRESTLRVGAPLRVALISDLHIGLYQGRERTQQIVTALNALDVDVVVVAGDWTYEPPRPLAELLAPLAGCRHRMLSVPGNHDEEMPGPPLAQELRDALLANRVEPIEGQVATVRGVRFVGLGDRWAHKDALPAALAGDLPLVALAHNPDSVDRLAGTPIRTLLAGHTHGGQINLPILTEWALATATRGGFKRGLYPRGERQVFVTSGLGMIGLPLRFMQPPVIDVLRFE